MSTRAAEARAALAQARHERETSPDLSSPDAIAREAQNGATRSSWAREARDPDGRGVSRLPFPAGSHSSPCE
jgi:hypothetical protein